MRKSMLIKYCIALIIFVGGLGVLLYPAISGLVNERSQTAVISNYEDAVAALSADDQAKSLAVAQSYNESLVQSQAEIRDPFGSVDGEKSVEEVSFVKVGELLGYIQIPKIGIKAPLYEGTSEDVLQKGIGWLKGTSLPVGGESTNSVLTGHRGLPTAKLFTDLDQMVVGDEFYVRNSNEILAYQVVEVRIIDPMDTDALEIVRGVDRVTLLTCHPYMINSQRLLVIGERIPYVGQLDDQVESGGFIESFTAAEKDMAIAGATALVLVVFLILVIGRPWKKLKKKGPQHGEFF